MGIIIQAHFPAATHAPEPQRTETTIFGISTKAGFLGTVPGVDAGTVKDRGDKYLTQLCEDTGGQAFFTGSMLELERAFKRISEELRTQYLITYRPANQNYDGRERKIEVRFSNDKGEDLKIRIGDCSHFLEGFSYAARIARDYDKCNQYVKFTSNPFTVPERGDVNIGDRVIYASTDTDFNFDVERKGLFYTTPCDAGLVCDEDDLHLDGGSVYFSIADATLAGREYANERRSEFDAITQPRIEYPDHRWSQFYPPTYMIRIPGSSSSWTDQGFKDGGVIHEYGHFLAYKISYLNPFGGDHRLCDNNVPEFSWNEGWCEYFGTIVVHRDQQFGNYTTGSLMSPNLGYNEIEDQLCGTEDGEHYEGNVAAVLWDLADDPATFQGSDPEAWDTVQDNEDLTFMVFDAEFGGGGAGGGAWVPTLCTFVDHGWDDYSEHRMDATDEIDPLLSHMNVEC